MCGSSIKRQSGNLVAAVWHDKCDTRIVSSNSNPVDGTVQRWNGREVMPVPCSMSIIKYNACLLRNDAKNTDSPDCTFHSLRRQPKASNDKSNKMWKIQPVIDYLNRL